MKKIIKDQPNKLLYRQSEKKRWKKIKKNLSYKKSKKKKGNIKNFKKNSINQRNKEQIKK